MDVSAPGDSQLRTIHFERGLCVANGSSCTSSHAVYARDWPIHGYHNCRSVAISLFGWQLTIWQPGKEVIDVITDFLQCLWQHAKAWITKDIGAVADLGTYTPAIAWASLFHVFFRFCRNLVGSPCCMGCKELRYHAPSCHRSWTCAKC